MNDFYDRAQALEQNQREGFIQLHKEKQNRAAVSAYFCERCEEPIPEARREAVIGCAYCIDCQRAIEYEEARRTA